MQMLDKTRYQCDQGNFPSENGTMGEVVDGGVASDLSGVFTALITRPLASPLHARKTNHCALTNHTQIAVFWYYPT
jgi:hypothetical protein